jgi:hypothetical protein
MRGVKPFSVVLNVLENFVGAPLDASASSIIRTARGRDAASAEVNAADTANDPSSINLPITNPHIVYTPAQRGA